MESKSRKVMCQGCSCLFHISSILKHLSKMKPCRNQYSKEDFAQLKQLCEAEAKRKTSLRKAINFKENKLKQEDQVTNIIDFFLKIF